MPSRPIPRSYALADVLELLRLPSNSTFYRSGLSECIARYPPGVYDADAVEEWSDRLARRRARIRLGLMSETSALVAAPGDDGYDLVCPACGRLAVQRPWTSAKEGERDLPAACGWCDWSAP